MFNVSCLWSFYSARTWTGLSDSLTSDLWPGDFLWCCRQSDSLRQTMDLFPSVRLEDSGKLHALMAGGSLGTSECSNGCCCHQLRSADPGGQWELSATALTETQKHYTTHEPQRSFVHSEISLYGFWVRHVCRRFLSSVMWLSQLIVSKLQTDLILFSVISGDE